MRFYRSALFLVLLFCGMHAVLFSQSLDVDSLKNLLEPVDDTTQVRLLNQLSKAFRATDIPQSIAYGEKALDLSRKIDFTDGEILALRNLGFAYKRDLKVSIGLDYLHKSADIAERTGNTRMLADNNIDIGSTYLSSRALEKSLEHYLTSYSLYEKLNNKVGLGKALSGIGLVYMHQANYEKAMKTLLEALAIFEQINDEKEVTRMYITIANTYEVNKDYAKAMEFYFKANDYFEKVGNEGGKTVVLLSLGDIHRKQRKWDKSIFYLEKTLEHTEKLTDKTNRSYALMFLGDVYRETGNNELALKYYFESLPAATQLKYNENLINTYRGISTVYADMNDFKNAYKYQILTAAYEDSVFSIEKDKLIAEMQGKFDMSSKEKEIEILKKDKLLNQVYLVAAAVGLISMIAIGLLVINRQRLKSQKDRELARKELQIAEEQRALAEAEIQNRVLREKQLETEIEFKNKELTTFTLNLIQKNEILEELKLRIGEIRNAADDSAKPQLSGILSTVNFSFHLDRDWDNFKLHFQQVHKNFFEKLTELYPELSSNDMKVCALLKLNLGTKEMASILDISAESVKAARYRIRKKVGAASEQSLSSFFNSLSY